MFSVFVARANMIIYKLARANILIELNWIKSSTLYSATNPAAWRLSGMIQQIGYGNVFGYRTLR